MNMGFAWHGPRWADELDPQPRPSSDRAYFRSHGVDVDAAPRRPPMQRRTTRLRAAVPAAFSVFRELMRRPADGTVVVLVPRSELPAVLGDATAERTLRAS
jgi:hypothetical protein